MSANEPIAAVETPANDDATETGTPAPAPPPVSRPHRLVARIQSRFKRMLGAPTDDPSPVPPFVIRLAVDGEPEPRLTIVAEGAAGIVSASQPLEGVRAIVAATRAATHRRDTAQAGKALTDAVFTPEIVDLFQRCRRESDGKPLPILLDVADPELATWPWEWLMVPGATRSLALDEKLPLSRRVPGPVPSIPTETGALRVTIVHGRVAETDLEAIGAIAGNPRIVAAMEPAGEPLIGSPHVLHLAAGVEPPTAADLPLLVRELADPTPPAALDGPAAELVLPTDWSPRARTAFLAALYDRLAEGYPIDRGLARARRSLAKDFPREPLAWSRPRLAVTAAVAPLVRPDRSVASLLVDHARVRSTTFVRDGGSGILAALFVWLAGLLAVNVLHLRQQAKARIGVSSVLAPGQVFDSFRGFVIELSTYRDRILLVAAFIMLLLTAAAVVLWWRRRGRDPVSDESPWSVVLDALGSLTVIAFLAVTTVCVFSAYAYQWYLWNRALPFADDQIGFAVARGATTKPVRDSLARAFESQGQTAIFGLREIPVQFDVGDYAQARELAERINARGIVIYDESEVQGQEAFQATILFTDPAIGMAVSTSPGQPPTVKEGESAPVLGGADLQRLVAAAAGIVAYHEDRTAAAIRLLRGAAGGAGDGAVDPAPVAFYLGNAYLRDGQRDLARTEFLRLYEHLCGAAAACTPQSVPPADQAILVRALIQLGALDAGDGALDRAMERYEAARGFRSSLTDPQGNPAGGDEHHYLYARLFAEMALVQRFLAAAEFVDEERNEADRDADEFAELAAEELQRAEAIAGIGSTDDPYPLIRNADTRLAMGDCVGAIEKATRALDFAPDNPDALYTLAFALAGQGETDRAAAILAGIADRDPTNIRVRQELAALWLTAAATSDGSAAAALGQTDRYAAEVLEGLFDLDYRSLVTRAAASGLSGTASWQGLGPPSPGNQIASMLGSDRALRDPAAIARAIAAYDEEIASWRTVVSDVRSDSIDAKLALAAAIVARLRLEQALLFERDLANDATVQAATPIPSDPAEVGNLAGDVRTLTARVLAPDAGATRLQRLHAWNTMIATLAGEYDRLRYGDTAAGVPPELRTEYGASVAGAVAEIGPIDFAAIDAATIATSDEVRIVADILFQAQIYAMFVEPDGDVAREYDGQWRMLAGRLDGTDARGLRDLRAARCDEERFRVVAWLRDNGQKADADVAAAYERALAVNPAYVPALLDYAASLFDRHEDDAGPPAELARRATEADASNPDAWAALAIYSLATGQDAGAAFQSFVDAAGAQPLDQRLQTLGSQFDLIRIAVFRRPDIAAGVASALPLFESAVAALPASADTTARAARVTTALAWLALVAGDPATAERLERQSLTADPRQPRARAVLALAVLAQGRDAGLEIDAAVAEIDDPTWEAALVDRSFVAAEMVQAVRAYRRLVDDDPALAALLQPFLDALMTA
jgi:Tfp pilus assembly protein PilF